MERNTLTLDTVCKSFAYPSCKFCSTILYIVLLFCPRKKKIVASNKREVIGLSLILERNTEMQVKSRKKKHIRLDNSFLHKETQNDEQEK